MRRLAEILIVVNGFLIPVFAGFFVYRSFPGSFKRESDYKAESIIVGDKLEKAKNKNLALQGVSYVAPVPIYNSANFYLPISAKTFDEARNLKEESERAGDFNSGWFNYVNVLFLDQDYNVITRLLNKKASIAEISIPGRNYYLDPDKVDKTVKNIAYIIGFDDTNNDGKLDYLDFHDLYISDLDGKNLSQVTTDKYIIDYQFVKSNSAIFIRYMDRDDQPDEYKPVKFGVFHIATGEFKTLREIEEQVKEVESILIN